jgi:gamma-glutamyltranspeptidase/glutathione hydrolase
MKVVDYGMNIQEAVNAPRIHHQWLPDVAYVEQWFSPDTVRMLQSMGYKVKFGVQYEEWEPYWSDGECVMVAADGERLGASDKRNNGRPVGF